MPEILARIKVPSGQTCMPCKYFVNLAQGYRLHCCLIYGQDIDESLGKCEKCLQACKVKAVAARTESLLDEVRAICNKLAAIDMACESGRLTEGELPGYKRVEKQCNRRLREIVSGRG